MKKKIKNETKMTVVFITLQLQNETLPLEDRKNNKKKDSETGNV